MIVRLRPAAHAAPAEPADPVGTSTAAGGTGSVIGRPVPATG